MEEAIIPEWLPLEMADNLARAEEDFIIDNMTLTDYEGRDVLRAIWYKPWTWGIFKNRGW